VLQNVNELPHKKSAPQSLQMLTILYHLYFNAWFLPLLHLIPRLPLFVFRGGKGNNLFLSAKIF